MWGYNTELLSKGGEENIAHPQKTEPPNDPDIGNRGRI